MKYFFVYRSMFYLQPSSSRGQTMMEYVILVALLAVASIPVAKTLGNVFRDRVMVSAREISGTGDYQSQSKDMIEKTKGRVLRHMGNFGD